MKKRPFTRRQFISVTASAATLSAPFIRTAGAAGKLSVGLWDHFVPTSNRTSDELIQNWAAREKVEVQIDRFSGGKALLIAAAETQAKTGHDILYLTSWLPHQYASSLEPVDDIMGDLIKQNGGVTEIVSYLGRDRNHWLAVPATIGNQIQSPCSRIDLMKQLAGIDVQSIYPAGAPAKAENWNLDTFLQGRGGMSQGRLPIWNWARNH